MKKIRYALEAILLYMLFVFFKLLPPPIASNIGGAIGRFIGPLLAASRKARRHLALAIPDLSEQQQQDIIKGMWDNLGRVIAEYPHLETICKKHTQVQNVEFMQECIENNTPMILIGGHIANWEINSVATLTLLNHPIDITFRAPNNPWVASLLDNARTLKGRITGYPKSRDSGKKIMKALKNKKSIGILVDQKYNEGLNVPFFNRDAMTNPVFVKLCQKYKTPLIPVRNQRHEGCSFTLTAFPPIPVFNEDGTPRQTEDVIAEVHTLLESWIEDTPEQWIWMHKRWGKSKRLL
ncbi:MAG: lysophospholipid acyltransferase family protein [Alphaproteobacteria bacterium]